MHRRLCRMEDILEQMVLWNIMFCSMAFFKKAMISHSLRLLLSNFGAQNWQDKPNETLLNAAM